jgi:signal transduction histidine kinase
MRASTQIARRLMALQRQRLAESQIADRRTRRVLHDEILPDLHAALLALSSSQADHQDVIAALSSAHHQIANLLRDLPVVTAPDVYQLGLIDALKKTITNEFSSAFEEVVWEIADDISCQLEQVSPLVSEVVYFAAREAIRNAARHGRVLPTLRIAANRRVQELEVVIEDNGGGKPDLHKEGISSGQGLVLHSTMMAVIGGELVFEQVAEETTRVLLRVPVDGN